MGNAESVDIPGGGTEGYHVLRVSFNKIYYEVSGGKSVYL